MLVLAEACDLLCAHRAAHAASELMARPRSLRETHEARATPSLQLSIRLREKLMAIPAPFAHRFLNHARRGSACQKR